MFCTTHVRYKVLGTWAKNTSQIAIFGHHFEKKGSEGMICDLLARALPMPPAAAPATALHHSGVAARVLVFLSPVPAVFAMAHDTRVAARPSRMHGYSAKLRPPYLIS